MKPRLCIGLLTAIAAIGAEPAVQWSGIDGGFQLGIAGIKGSGGTPGQLQFTIRNLGSEWRSIHFGSEGSAGPYYDIGLTADCARELSGNIELFDLNALRASAAGFMSETWLLLEASEAHFVTISVARFIGVINGRDIPLEALLQRGCSIRASFQPVGHVLTWAHTLVTPPLLWSQFQ